VWWSLRRACCKIRDWRIPFGQLDVQTSNFVPVGPKTSLSSVFPAAPHSEAKPDRFQISSLSGPFRLGAYLPYEFLGNHYAYSALGFHRELYRLPELAGGKIDWAGWYEAGTAFGREPVIPDRWLRAAHSISE
jgi:hypothetical protein